MELFEGLMIVQCKMEDKSDQIDYMLRAKEIAIGMEIEYYLGNIPAETITIAQIAVSY